MSSDFANDNSDTEIDSDEELQEAYAKGLLKPGLNEIIEKEEKKYVNNVVEMKSKLEYFKLDLPWVETLDLITTVAPIAPESVMQIEEIAQRRKNLKENNRGNKLYDPKQDPVLNEFKRENMLQRQAQVAVIEGIKRLKMLKLPTRRPDDYFAEMAKSDDHMQKVRKNVMSKQAAQARVEKVRQLREQKKVSKRVQIDTKLKLQAEKKQTLDKLKRVRKGQSSDLGFLDDNKGKNSQGHTKNKISKKRSTKNAKFGFGGKKKGRKLNTSESTYQIYQKAKGNKKNKQRPGKAKRKNLKR